MTKPTDSLTAQIEGLIGDLRTRANRVQYVVGPIADQLAALLPAVRELEEQKGVMPSERDSIADVSNSVPAVRTAIRRAEPPDTRLPVTTGEQHPDKDTATKLEAAEQRVRELEQKLEYVRRAAMNCNIGTHDGTPGPYGTIEAILNILADE